MKHSWLSVIMDVSDPLRYAGNSLGSSIVYDLTYLSLMIAISTIRLNRTEFLKLIMPGYILLCCGPHALFVNSFNALKSSQDQSLNVTDAETLLCGILLSIISIILSFGIVLHIAGLKYSDSAAAKEVTRFDAIYFSAITWSTVGYGDVSPATRSAKVLVAIEALFGYLMLGLLATQFPGLGAVVGNAFFGQ